jgi:hypothetical protein
MTPAWYARTFFHSTLVFMLGLRAVLLYVCQSHNDNEMKISQLILRFVENSKKTEE